MAEHEHWSMSLKEAVALLRRSRYTTAFTGAGISVESGIPPFRGSEGLWSKYDPVVLDINYFQSNPLESWKVIKEIFYDFFGKAKPNRGHLALAAMEQAGYLNNIITQNIDNLHQEAGNRTVYEFHGNSHTLVCTACGKPYGINDLHFDQLPIRCKTCGGLVKPDFIFFGEGIPTAAYEASLQAARSADVFLVVGTTGEIMPASQIPHIAKQNGAKIVEINPEPSTFTHTITDVYLQGKAGTILPELIKRLLNP